MKESPVKQAIRSQSDESIRAFWRAYMAWMTTAPDDDIVQLERALTDLQTVQGRRTLRPIRPALRSGYLTRAMPASLVQQLEKTSTTAV
jgi:hypothetical protein